MGKIIPISVFCIALIFGAYILYQKTYESSLKAKWGSKNDAAITAILQAQEEANKKKERVDEAIRQLVDGPNNPQLDRAACRVLEEAGLLEAPKCPIRPGTSSGQSDNDADRK